jgi:hypothetical protein
MTFYMHFAKQFSLNFIVTSGKVLQVSVRTLHLKYATTFEVKTLQLYLMSGLMIEIS